MSLGRRILHPARINRRESSGTGATELQQLHEFSSLDKSGISDKATEKKTQPGAEGLGINKGLWNDRTAGILWENWSNGKDGKGFYMHSLLCFRGIKRIIL